MLREALREEFRRIFRCEILQIDDNEVNILCRISDMSVQIFQKPTRKDVVLFVCLYLSVSDQVLKIDWYLNTG